MSKAIKILNKRACTGCCACKNVCPKRCVTMESDNEGFWYPKVDMSLCNKCGLCSNICPLLKEKVASIEELTPPQVFAAWNKDHRVRLDSTSGGIFSALADKMFDAEGFVAGAIYKEDHRVSHIVTNDRLMLDGIRSSKYLQSYTGELFNKIKNLLEDGQKVLICATPCQIAGLYAVLGRNYEKLISCDFLCIGVGSPKVFLKYMAMLEQRYRSIATKIKFKNKTFGWHRFATRIDFANGETYIQDRYHDPYMRSLLNAYIVRPCCYECRFKRVPRLADITLADFWGIEKIRPELDNDCGTSAVIVNSEKGKNYLHSVAQTIICHELSIDDVAAENSALNQSIQCSSDREVFFSLLDSKPFNELANLYFPVSSSISRIASRVLAKPKSAARVFYHLFREMRFSFSSWSQFIYLNFLRKNTQRKGRSLLVPATYSRINVDRKAKIVISNGLLIIGHKQHRKSRNETCFKIDKNSTLEINGNFKIYSGCDVRVYENSHLTLNGGYCNIGSQIACYKKITIGKEATIARNVCIIDTDAHKVDQNQQMNQEIIIGDHVWIGYRAIILKGITIGDGAVVAAGSIVTKNIPARCVVAEAPARVIRENIYWK